MLHDAIFLVTCLAMALRDKLRVDCSVRVTCHACNLFRNSFGLANIEQSILVSHGAIFHSTCLATLEKEINCKLQKSCYKWTITLKMVDSKRSELCVVFTMILCELKS